MDVTDRENMGWHVDARNRLALPGIHDATLEALAYRPARGLALRIPGQGGERTSIGFERVHRTNLCDLWEQAIVDSIFVWDDAAVPEADWAQGDIGWRALLAGRTGLGRDARASAADLVRAHPGATLATVSCAYGGSLSVLCEAVRIQQTRRTR